MKQKINKILIYLLLCTVAPPLNVYSEETTLISNEQIKEFLKTTASAKSNPNGLIYLSRDIFRKGYILPRNYDRQLNIFFVKEEENIKHYHFLDLRNEGGNWWVKLEVNAENNSVNRLNAMGKTYVTEHVQRTKYKTTIESVLPAGWKASLGEKDFVVILNIDSQKPAKVAIFHCTVKKILLGKKALEEITLSFLHFPNCRRLNVGSSYLCFIRHDLDTGYSLIRSDMIISNKKTDLYNYFWEIDSPQAKLIEKEINENIDF